MLHWLKFYYKNQNAFLNIRLPYGKYPLFKNIKIFKVSKHAKCIHIFNLIVALTFLDGCTQNRVLLTPPCEHFDYVWWQTQDKKALRRVNALIKDVMLSPFQGLGKPEPLQGDLSGLWSRRIDLTNRLIYMLQEDMVTILSCKDHILQIF